MTSGTHHPRTEKRRTPAVAPESVDALALADRLRLSATRLARRLRQESGTDLTPSQLSALAAIDRHGPLTLGALADVERVAPPSVTKAVTKLEAEGLVARRVDDADRRVAWVSLTSTGTARLARIRRRRSVWLATRLNALDARDRARLADALDVLDELAADTR
jgi:DNA-binding MarR family transcriptional regulator